jgi:phage repressor protein C with HTH and peptisase S24 domain
MNEQFPVNDLLDIQAFSRLFNNTTNSYKYLFFLALLKNINESHTENKNEYRINFIELATEMLLIAWFPYHFFKLSFGVQDQCAQILSKFIKAHYFETNEISITDSSINKLRINLKKWLNVEQDSLRLITKYVPFRLLTPFFESELRGMLDGKKNKQIKILAEKQFLDKRPLYKISSDSIIVHDHWLMYLRQHYSIIDGWVKWHWCEYLQNKNLSVPSIPRKILPFFKRESMRNETEYWKKILEYKTFRCIYSNHELAEFSLDHFLPWSFVTHNQLWNLIPVTKQANSSKSNNLPDMKAYFQNFVSQQHESITISKKIFSEIKWKKHMEPYISDLHLSCYDDILDQQKLETAYQKTISPLYEIAKNLNFNLDWQFPYKIFEENIQKNENNLIEINQIIEQEYIAEIKDENKYVTHLPLCNLKIAAGEYSHSEFNENLWHSDQWIDIELIGLFRNLNKAMFISKIHGHSMEPDIPDGSYCLFRYGVTGSRNGKIVLVKKSGYEDPDTHTSFTIKRYYSEKITDPDYDWVHEKIELRPNNPDYSVLIVEEDEAENFTVIAEFLQVVG